jgi:ribosomal-protein-alanine N-acetyltransferase
VDFSLGDRQPAAAYNHPVEYSLRDGRSSDLDALWRIDQACFPPGISYSRLELAVYMRRPGAFTLVAEQPRPKAKSFGDQPGVILGFLVMQQESDKAGHIVTIDVVGNVRRAGVGSRLMTAAEARVRAAGFTSIYLEAMVTNHSAIEFYQRHGFSVSRTETAYYADGTDAFVFVKDLLSSAASQ